MRNTIAAAAIIAASMVGVGATVSLTTPPAPQAQQAQQAQPSAEPTVTYKWAQDDNSPVGFNCTTMGSHICKPGNPEKLAAGCYDNATLVIPWEKMTRGQKRHTKTSPCAGMAPTQEQESDAAYAAAQQH
jgi:hypothetical protein